MPTLAEAKQAAEQGAVQQARLMYETILQENPRSEEAWLGLAEVLTDKEDKRVCYKNVLKINKKNREAKEGIRSLDPQTDTLREMFDIAPANVEEEPPPVEEEAAVVDEPDKTRATKRQRTRAQSAARSTSQADTPTPVLVAFGLALSVVFFAIGSGIVYFLLDSLVSS